MKRSPYWILMVIVTVAGALAWPSFTEQAHAQQEERHAESGGSTAASLSQTKAVTLTAAEQKRLGIQIAVLTGKSEQKRITAPAVVLSAQSLATGRNSYVAAQAQLEKAQVNLGVAQKEYARLETLYKDNQNVSLKDLQAAQGARGADEIDVRMARQQLALQASLIRQNWGSVATGWVTDPSPVLDRLLARKEILIQVSLPDSQVVPPPEAIWLTLGNTPARRARFVSPLPQVDPRVQGVSLLYLTPAWAGVAPGVTLEAQLPVGHNLRGFVIPASAVVWADGESWVYVQTVPSHFVRRPLVSDFSSGDGYFAIHGFSKGEKLVVSGAQFLLSAELSPPASSSGDSDEGH